MGVRLCDEGCGGKQAGFSWVACFMDISYHYHCANPILSPDELSCPGGPHVGGEDGDALLAALPHAPLRVDQRRHHRRRDRFLHISMEIRHRQTLGRIGESYQVELVAGEGEEGEDDNVEDGLPHHRPLVAVGVVNLT